MDRLERFIRDSATARDEQELFTCYSKVMREFGFDAESYWLDKLTYKTLPNLKHRTFISAPKPLYDLYLDDGIGLKDGAQNAARTKGQIVDWHDQIENTDLDPEYKDFLSEVHSTGFRAGLVIPLFGKSNEVAFVRAGMYNGRIDLTEDEKYLLRLISYQFHERLNEIVSPSHDIPDLSPRELEVMKWMAAGKSASVIADILQISEHTVDTYLRRCYQKLGVSNRIAAILKAINLGLIHP